MLKAFKYRIYPTDEQKSIIDQTISACRLVYNLALEVKIAAWQSLRKNMSVYDIQLQLKELQNEYKWLKSVDSQAIRASVRLLDVSFKNFFRGAGFPKFKSKKGRQSFHCPNNTREIDFDNSTLTIPKIKNIPIIISRRFTGDIKKVTISKTATGKYFASILIDNAENSPERQQVSPESIIGIDVGIKTFVVTSNGQVFEPNRYLKKSLNRLQCLQRRATRKKKGSNARKKAALCVSKLHEKITNQRYDYIHKITTQLIRDNQANSFVIEDLYVAGMLKNRKLSKAISDVSFGEFFRQMKYKCDWYGKNLIIIDRFAPSSKRCSECGEINKDLTLSDREWECKCGVFHDRDLNAAKNIKWFGLELYAGAGSAGGPVELQQIC